MGLIDYDILGILHGTDNSTVSRAVRKKDGLKVIIKQAPPSSNDTQSARVRYEHRILEKLTQLSVAGIPQVVDFITDDHPILVMKDIGGASLRELMGTQRLELDTLLHIMIQVSATLGEIHRARISHKDINPQNIIFNPQTGEVQLIDFGIASFLSHEMQVSSALSAIEGTISYISPEQTGRLNRLLDYRSDFYSLGVTFYELISGELPFTQQLLAELVHAILSKPARPVRELRLDIPQQLSNLVDVMMAKSADDRYQSAFGLHHDLERCRAELSKTSTIEGFPLKLQDRIERFQVPQKLYGREADIKKLLGKYDSASAGRHELLLVRGPSGIGKSMLVNELQSAVLARQGLLAQGKYDQLRRHIPFSAFSQAIAGLVRRILLEDETTVNRWRQRARDALGNIGQAIIEVVPSVQQLVGPQPPVPALSPQESEARLLNLLERFVRMLCQEKPLALFLDDLQWCDSGTLKLLKLLCSTAQSTAGFLFIGAYRDNEVGAEHPLMLMLDDLAKAGVAIDAIVVAPLSLHDIKELIMGATRAGADASLALAQVVAAKTAGNPFFVHEFLKHLWTQELLQFDGQAGRWQWSLDAIKSVEITDNVVDLMSKKLRQLPAEQQRLASMAACLGAEFSINALSTVFAQPTKTIAASLQQMLEAGLLLPLARGYRYAEDSQSESEDVRYKFAHDRVQQAAFEVLNPEEVAQYHCQIGRQLLKERGNAPMETWVFEVVDHLNAAVKLLSAQECLNLATLNLVAAKESKRAMAYAIAATYCERGIALIGETAWNGHYDLARALFLEAAEDDFLLGKNEEARRRLDLVLSKSKTPLEKADVQRRRSQAMAGLSLWRECIDAAMDGMEVLGFKIMRKPHIALILPRLLFIANRFKKIDNNVLANAPVIADEREKMILELMSTYMFAAYTCDSLVWLNTSVVMLDLTMKSGNSKSAAYTYACLVPVLLSMDDYSTAKKAADLSMLVLEKFPESNSPSFVALCDATFVKHAMRKPNEVTELFHTAYQIGTNSGDLISAGLNAAQSLLTAQQTSLERGQAVVERYNNFLKGNTPYNWNLFLTRKQAVACFMGKTQGPLSFDDATYKEAVDAKTFPSPSLEVMHFTNKAWVQYVHGDTAVALDSVTHLLSKKAFDTMDDATMSIVRFISAVVMTSDAIDNKHPIRHPKVLKQFMKKFRALATAGEIYSGYIVLIEAQLAVLAGKDQEALALYDRATALLSERGYASAAAIAYERAAKFCLARQMRTSAQFYCARAVEAYATWGATVKVGMLRAQWSAHLLKTRSRTQSVSHTTSTHGTVTSTSNTYSDVVDNNLDLPAIMRASQSLSGEVVLSKLVVRIMDSMREMAGADRAAMVLRQADKMIVVSDTANIQAAERGLPVNAAELPERVLALVQKSGESVLLDDASNDEDFLADPYIAAQKPRSMLCAPILHQGKMLGLVYLENRLLGNAFTADRMLSVSILASQAAISIENAYVYNHLEATVSERTAQLKEANDKLIKLEREQTEVQMAGGFAHEMRNALSGAQMLIQVVNGLDVDEESVMVNTANRLETVYGLVNEHMPEPHRDAVVKQLGSIAQNTESLENVFKELDGALARGTKITSLVLEYAQLGRVVARSHATVSVNMVLDKLMKEFEDQFAANAIKANVDISQQLDVKMGEDHLYAILRNLLANARDAMGGSEREVKNISVKAEVQDGQVVMTVEDTGGGIPELMQHRLFEPFFSTKGAKGTGLGLGVSRKLAELYGGTITFASREKVGTTFRVVVPLTVNTLNTGKAVTVVRGT